MATYQTTVPTALAADRAFDYLADFANTAQWDPGTQSAQQTTSGEIAVGTVFRLTVKFLGRGLPLDYEVVAYDSATRTITLRAENSSVVATDTIKVAPRGTGSVVDYQANLQPKKLAWLFDPLLTPLFRLIGGQGRAGMLQTLQKLAAEQG